MAIRGQVLAVMGVDAAGVAAEGTGSEELAVRGGGGATTKHRRQRLAPGERLRNNLSDLDH
jgi:hypothetical protein